MYKLITHTDLDGISCAILAKLAWKDQVDVTFCALPSDVTNSLLKLYKEEAWKRYNLIFVTDLSFDASIVKECPKFKNVLRLFDHHQTSVEPFKPYVKWATVLVTLDGRNTCGTELFYRYLRKKGLVGNRDYYVELVRLYDTWDWVKTTSKLPNHLSNLVFKLGLPYFYHTFTERLMYHDVTELNLFNQYERDILSYEEQRERTDVDSFLSQVYFCEVKTNDYFKHDTYRIGVIFNASYYSSLLGNEMCSKLGVDIALMVNLNRNRIEVRTARDDIDLGTIMRDLYNGGGHAKAAGGNINLAHEVIQKLIAPIGTVTEIKRTNK